MKETVRVETAAGMRALGRRLARLLRAGDLVILSGPLGAGKTTLVQGIGSGLRVRGPVTSPTFVIARVHPAAAGPALVHADAYRLASVGEVDDLDLDADTARSVTVVEWGEGLAEELAEDRLEISIAPDARAGAGGGAPAGAPGGADAAGGAVPDSFDGDEDSPRVVRLSGIGPRWSDVALPPANAD